MKIQLQRPLYRLLFVLLLLAASTIAEDSQDSQDAEDGEDAEYADYAQEAQNDQDGDEDVYQSSISVCADAVIEVKDIVLLCDSPGTYYYGSNKYRDSATCKAGDKAKLQVDFYIDDPDTIASLGGYALTTIKVQGYKAIESQIVYENADLCSLSSLQSLSGVSCPGRGNYRISTQFSWGERNSNLGYNFIPKPSVGFKSNINKEAYDLGGANTNLCRGNTFISWSEGVRTQYANALSNFMKSFGILLLTIGVMGGFIYWLVKKPDLFSGNFGSKFNLGSKLNFGSKKTKLIDEHDEEDEDGFHKVAMVGKNDILDF
jgi:hypothetical protein